MIPKPIKKEEVIINRLRIDQTHIIHGHLMPRKINQYAHFADYMHHHEKYIPTKWNSTMKLERQKLQLSKNL